MSDGKAAPPGRRRTLVLLDSSATPFLADRIAALKRQAEVVRVVDYRHLMSQVEAVRQVLREHRIDFLLFSPNDQVFDRVGIGPFIQALGVGYSSFSGIDPARALEETRTCLDDYLAGGSKLAIAGRSCVSHTSSSQEGTFSLLFDLEQLGGARFGLPRILDLLDRRGVTATFFVTSFVQEVYIDTLDTLRRHGHEVGLHGRYHEFLAGQPLHQQTTMIGQMKSDFGSAEQIRGANFIGRMDADSVRAMISQGLDYFVVFMQHSYRPFAFRKMPLRPMMMSSPAGAIWMVPVSAETYNRPWFAVKNMVDSAIIAGHRTDWHHVNVLLHPFRDGSLSHIADLDRLVDYMQGRLGYRAIKVADVVQRLPRYQPDSLIYYGFDGVRQGVAKGHFWPAWWHHQARYQQRIGNLYQALAHGGHRPALCLDLPLKGTVYAVYPHLPQGIGRVNAIRGDPLLLGRSLDGLFTFDSGAAGEEELLLHAFVPGGRREDLANAAWASLPRFRQDYAGLLPETALRVAYRLTPHRRLF